MFSFDGKQNQVYELYAIVDHVGSLRGGHYCARIKDENGWCMFNDNLVTLVRKINLMLNKTSLPGSAAVFLDFNF